MVAVTYGFARAVAAAVTGDKAHRGLLARFYAALIRSRMIAAQREIALHRHLFVPRDDNGRKI